MDFESILAQIAEDKHITFDLKSNNRGIEESEASIVLPIFFADGKQGRCKLPLSLKNENSQKKINDYYPIKNHIQTYNFLSQRSVYGLVETIGGSLPRIDYLPNYYLMPEYTPLDASIKSLHLEERLKAAADISGILSNVHKNKRVHRDVKISNLYLDNGISRLSDFDISDVQGKKLFTNQISGTPLYFPKEQMPNFWPESIDQDPNDWPHYTLIVPEADTYAFGKVFVALLMGWDSIDLSSRFDEHSYSPIGWIGNRVRDQKKFSVGHEVYFYSPDRPDVSVITSFGFRTLLDYIDCFYESNRLYGEQEILEKTYRGTKNILSGIFTSYENRISMHDVHERISGLEILNRH